MATSLINLANYEQMPHINLIDKFRDDSAKSLEPFLSGISNDWKPDRNQQFLKKSFKNFSLKRVSAISCNFTECNFSNSAGAGSVWFRSNFNACIFDDTNMQFSNFSECVIEGSKQSKSSKIISSNFHASNFKGATLRESYIKGCSFTNVDFSYSIITDMEVSSCTFESSNFTKSTLKNIDFSNTNIEYADFSESIIENVRLPFWQFAYIFGISHKDISDGKVMIVMPSKGEISAEEVFKYIPSLISHYLAKESYFPCVNLMMLSNHPDFEKFINESLKLSLERENARELKYLSKVLANSNRYSQSELSSFYSLMSDVFLNKDVQIQNEWALHEGEIRQFLLKKKNQDSIDIYFIIKGASNESSGALNTVNLLSAFSMLEKILDIEISFDNILVTKNSPLKIKVENITINIKTEEKDKNTKSIESKIALTTSIMAILFQLPGTYKDLSELGILDSQKKEIIDCSERLYKKIKLDEMLIQCQSKSHLNYNKESLEKI